jgi:hypothetical protein
MVVLWLWGLDLNQPPSAVVMSREQKKELPGSRVSFMIWLWGLDLNQRPFGYEPNELPGCSTPRYIFIISKISEKVKIFS